MQTIDISWLGLASGYLLSLWVITLFFLQKISLIKKYLIAILRMTVQLLGIGFVLNYIFEKQIVYMIIGWLFLMIFTTAQVIVSNSHLSFRIFYPRVLLIILATTLFTLFFFILIILQSSLEQIFQPQYVIPIAGMLLGNTMNSAVLVLSSIKKAFEEKETEITQRIALGASFWESLLPIVRQAVKTASLPTISTMAGMGLVSLPGMMTGQILGGNSPFLAVKYQIAIMLAISFLSILNSFLIAWFCHTLFFQTSPKK